MMKGCSRVTSGPARQRTRTQTTPHHTLRKFQLDQLPASGKISRALRLLSPRWLADLGNLLDSVSKDPLFLSLWAETFPLHTTFSGQRFPPPSWHPESFGLTE